MTAEREAVNTAAPTEIGWVEDDRWWWWKDQRSSDEIVQEVAIV